MNKLKPYPTLTFLTEVITPALQVLEDLDKRFPYSREAADSLLLVALQESALSSRYEVLAQGAAGPKRGYWMMTQRHIHRLIRDMGYGTILTRLARARYMNPRSDVIWRALEANDLLAAQVARLMLPLEGTCTHENYAHAWAPSSSNQGLWVRNKEMLEALEVAYGI